MEKEDFKNKDLSDISTIVCDPYEAEYYFKERSTIPLESGYFVSLIEPTKAFHTECSFQWDGKKVGVLDTSGALFVKALARDIALMFLSYLFLNPSGTR